MTVTIRLFPAVAFPVALDKMVASLGGALPIPLLQSIDAVPVVVANLTLPTRADIVVGSVLVPDMINAAATKSSVISGIHGATAADQIGDRIGRQFIFLEGLHGGAELCYAGSKRDHSWKSQSKFNGGNTAPVTEYVSPTNGFRTVHCGMPWLRLLSKLNQ